ncbi:MAG: HAD family phosphatase [Chloroflexi bacterium]|nr:HAD family phosphatase [Chloroflexota bacterium]
MIKAVIFDFGGVILRTQDWSGRRKWEKRLGLAKNEAEAIVFNSDMGRKAQHGQVSYDEHWAWLGNHFNLTTAEQTEFETDFWAGDVLDKGLVTFICSLRPSYQTALISNAFDDLQRVLTDIFDIADAFDVIAISAEEGIMKPDPRLYQLTLERLDCHPEEAIFIDDFAHNIAGAREIGIKGILFTPDINLTEELQNLGIHWGE